MARPIVAVVMAHTQAKHGPWDEPVELAPSALVDNLQQKGALIVLVPSTEREGLGLADFTMPALAGIVSYSVTADGNSTGGDVAAFASERSLPYLAVSGDGSVDESAVEEFAAALRGRNGDDRPDQGQDTDL
jgi:hypothetical protein